MEKVIKKKSFKFASPSAFSIAIAFSLLVVILSWFVPGTMQDPVHKLGILDALIAPMYGFQKQAPVLIFILMISGFLHLLIHTEIINTAIKKISHKFKEKLYLLISILIISFAIGGTIFSIWEETLPFYPLLSPILLELGFDRFAVIFIIFLGSISGALGATVNPFAIGIAQNAANEINIIVGTSNGLLWRFIIFLIFTIIAIILGNIYCYFNRGKFHQNLQRKNIEKLNPFTNIFIHQEHKKKYNLQRNNNMITNNQYNNLNTKKLVVQRASASLIKEKQLNTFANLKRFSGVERLILIIAGLSFLIMFLALTPWDELFHTNTFVIVQNWVNQHMFWFVSNQLYLPFGQWDFIDLSGLFFTSSLLIGILARIKDKKFFNILLKEGIIDLILVVFIIAFFAGIAILLSKAGLLNLLLHKLETGFQPLSIILIFVIIFFLFFILSFFIPSQSSLALAIFPIFGPLIYKISGNNSNAVALAIIVFVLANGLANMFAPSVGVIHAICELEKLKYSQFVQVIYKILIFYAVLAFIIILTLTTLL